MVLEDDESFQNQNLLSTSKKKTKPSSSKARTDDEVLKEISIDLTGLGIQDQGPSPRHGPASSTTSPIELPLTEAYRKSSPQSNREDLRVPDQWNEKPASGSFHAEGVSQQRLIDVQSITSTSTSKAVKPKLRSETSDSDLAKRLVIAIDYGTTFTGVAVALVLQNEKFANLDDIDVIADWGKDMSNTLKVPSAYSYTVTNTDDEQWGASISSNATVMVHTKLELDEQDCKSDELDIILHNLDGMGNLNFAHVEKSDGRPEFSPKKPDEIVTDYFRRIFSRVMTFIEKVRHIEEVDRNRMLVDIVFTVPVNWSYRAKNATYRAITQAGFNRKTFRKLHIMMLSEPEAAAVYTARFLKEKKAAEKLLKEDECFIICDAGGGTVDVVTFRVTQIEPTLEIEKVGIGRSGKFGSVFVDGEFKKWLRKEIIKEEYYELLEPNTNGRIKAHSTTSEGMRFIMQQFIKEKRRFTGKEGDDEVFRIEFPEMLRKVEHEAVDEGELLMVREEMEYLFKKPLNHIVKLILEQCELAEAYDRRVKNIFMIGGFGESKYLQARLATAMAQWEIEIYQPDTSWTAVVRGAAMHGIEKARLKNYIRTDCSPNNYGIAFDQEQVKGADDEKHQFESPVTGKIMGKDRMNWIIKRGDLILLSSTEAPETLLEFTFRERDKMDFVIPLYQYLEDDERLPLRLKGAAKEMRKVMEIPINFTGRDLSDFAMYPGPNEPYYQAIVSLKVIWVDGILHAEATWNQEVLFPSPSSPAGTSSQFTPESSIMSGSEGMVSVVAL